MGILDELKKEAERVRRLQEEEERHGAATRGHREGLRDRMLRIHHYLRDLIHHLDVAGWTVAADYAVPGVGEVRFTHSDYRIYVDDNADPKNISLRIDYVTSGPRRYSVTPRPTAEQFRAFLRAQQIVFSEWPIRAGTELEGALFQGRLKVLVSLLFQAQEENFGIKVTTHNFEGLMDQKLQFDYRNVDDDWLDRLGHYVLRKDRRFSSLDISEDMRTRLRQRLEEDNLRRQSEAGSCEAAEDAESRGLLRRLGRLLRGPSRK